MTYKAIEQKNEGNKNKPVLFISTEEKVVKGKIMKAQQGMIQDRGYIVVKTQTNEMNRNLISKLNELTVGIQPIIKQSVKSGGQIYTYGIKVQELVDMIERGQVWVCNIEVIKNNSIFKEKEGNATKTVEDIGYIEKVLKEIEKYPKVVTDKRAEEVLKILQITKENGYTEEQGRVMKVGALLGLPINKIAIREIPAEAMAITIKIWYSQQR